MLNSRFAGRDVRLLLPSKTLFPHLWDLIATLKIQLAAPPIEFLPERRCDLNYETS